MFLKLRLRPSPAERTAAFLETSDDKYYHLSTPDKSVELYLKKRTDYPTTYCRRISATRYQAGYGNAADDAEVEYLRISIDAEGNVRMQRDAYCTLPIFYACTLRGLFISNHYHEVAQSLAQATVSKEGVQHALISYHYTDRTLLEEVRILRERETLLYGGGRLSILQPAGRPWLGSAAAPSQDPRTFRQTLTRHMEHFYNTRLHGQQFAYEVSGGLDSATLPLFLSRRGVSNAPLASLIYTGDYTPTQLQKLGALAHYTRGPLITEAIDVDNDFPFNSILEGAAFPFFARDSFAECKDRYMRLLREQGVRVLSTGHGGDDLFEHMLPDNVAGFGEVEAAERRKRFKPLFTTQRFEDEYVDNTPSTPERPMTLHSPGFLMGRVYGNEYIDYDIWPVTPFASPGLYGFCQGLPVEFRANKNILRIFHASHNFPELIYNPVQNETFRGPLHKAIRSRKYDLLLARLLDSAVTRQLGYIDPDEIRRTYSIIQADQEKAYGIEQFGAVQLQIWIALELSLEATKNLCR